MTKKEFLKLIEENKTIYNCLYLENTTLRSCSPHASVMISWHGHPFCGTVVKTMRGKVKDVKSVEMLNKYKGWLENSGLFLK